LIRELTDEVEGTGARTGLLKAATSRPVLEGPEEKCSRAVARAQRATGAAITTHTSASARFEIAGGNAGAQFLDLFEQEGVDQPGDRGAHRRECRHPQPGGALPAQRVRAV
jgi:phosphotriesterase-related protein